MVEQPIISIITDDPSTSKLYALRLDDEYDVRTANSREEALEQIDADVTVVFLDRRMPDLSSDDLLTYVNEKGYDCRMGLISSVRPDVDVLEHGFDTALVTPVSEEELNETVERLLRRVEYDELLEEIVEVQSDLAKLEQEHSEEELEENDEYRELRDRFETLRRRFDEIGEDLDEEDFSAALHSLSRRSERRRE